MPAKSRLYYALIVSAMLGGALASCGPKRQAPESKLNWVPEGDATALLQKRDMEDPFRLKMNFLEVGEGLPGDLVNLGLEDTATLKLVRASGGQLLLEIIPEGQSRPYLSFEVTRKDEGYLVDFSSLTNHVDIQQPVESRTSGWTQDQSYSEASVKKLDEDTIEANLILRFRNDGKTAGLVLGVSLSRITQEAAPPTFVARSAQKGFSKNVGFFEEGGKVKRFPIPQNPSEKIVFYIENFPEFMQDGAIEAIESWNSAFDRDVIEARVAPESVHFGDREHNVVRWYDEDVGEFAGRASPVYASENGSVYSGNVQINGSHFEGDLRTAIEQSQSAFRSLKNTSATVGGQPFEVLPGETPFAPFYMGQDDANPRKTLERMYYNTIVHEIGHVLGLRHNFKGSVNLDSERDMASVMDYGPRAEMNFHTAGPGSYDQKALRWAYYGEDPGAVEFCTDGDTGDEWDCNYFDAGNPVTFTLNATVGATTFVKRYDDRVSERFLGVIRSMTALVHKFHDEGGLPPTERNTFEEEVIPAFDNLVNQELGLEEGSIQKKNLETLREIAVEFWNCLDSQGTMRCYKETRDDSPSAHANHQPIEL